MGDLLSGLSDLINNLFDTLSDLLNSLLGGG